MIVYLAAREIEVVGIERTSPEKAPTRSFGEPPLLPRVISSKGEEGRKDVVVCEDCGDALCVRCWRDFHTKEVFKIDDYCKIVSENN